jgi:hypothetical protein
MKHSTRIVLLLPASLILCLSVLESGCLTTHRPNLDGVYMSHSGESIRLRGNTAEFTWHENSHRVSVAIFNLTADGSMEFVGSSNDTGFISRISKMEYRIQHGDMIRSDGVVFKKIKMRPRANQ